MDKVKLAEELHDDEGFRDHAYQDSEGYWTIGYGRLIDKRKGGRITQEEADYLLDNDIEEKYHGLITALPWVTDHPDHVQRALCNMCFQLGVAGLLGFKRTLALIQAKKYEEAANNAMLSKWSKQTPERAKRVTDMIRLGEE
jgi:lysozyme